MDQDEDIKNIMELWKSAPINENIAETAKRIAHNYYFTDEQTKKKSWELEDDKKLEIQNKTAEISNNYSVNSQLINKNEKKK